MNTRTDHGPETSAPLRGGHTPIPVADVTLAVTSVFAATLIAIIAAFVFVPDVREWLSVRGGLVSWMATATLALAFGIGVWAYTRSTEESRFRLIIPGVAGLLVLQAVRFGADAIGYSLPVFSGVEVGSLFDVRTAVAETATTLSLGPGTGLLVLALLVLITGSVATRAWSWARTRVRVTETTVVVYLVIAIGFHFVVPTMGFFGDDTTAWFITNVAAFVGAGFLVIAGLASGDHRTTVAGYRRRMWAWMGEDHLVADTGQ